jgi:hypothetical protein
LARLGKTNTNKDLLPYFRKLLKKLGEFNPDNEFEIYYDLKSSPQAALLRTILALKYPNILSPKIVFAPCL